MVLAQAEVVVVEAVDEVVDLAVKVILGV